VVFPLDFVADSRLNGPAQVFPPRAYPDGFREGRARRDAVDRSPSRLCALSLDATPQEVDEPTRLCQLARTGPRRRSLRQ
jgi:hypothetical protein